MESSTGLEIGNRPSARPSPTTHPPSDGRAEIPTRLRLREFGGQVILDPRFGWGQPVVAENKVPVRAILGLWAAAESMEAIATEFRMDADDVDRIIRTYVKPLVA